MILEKRQQNPVVEQGVTRRLKNGEHLPIFPETHTGIIDFELTVENLTKKGSTEGKLLKEVYKRGRSFTINLPEGTLGEGTNHVDVIGKKFQNVRRLSPIQRIAQFLNITPEDLQDRLNLANTLDQETDGYNHPLVSEKIIKSAQQKFIKSSETQPTQERILLGATSNIDLMIRSNQDTIQKKINLAIDQAVKESEENGLTKEQVVDEIYRIATEIDPKKLPAKVEIMTHALGYILRTFQNPGGKVSIAKKEIIDHLEKIFYSPENSVKIGGASAQLADFFSAIGEGKSTLYTQYHSPEQSNAHNHKPDFLRTNDDSYSITDINQGANPNDPTKKNLVFEIAPNTIVTLPNGIEITSKPSADRIIFPADAYFDNQGNKLSSKPLFSCSQEILGQLVEKENILYFFLNGAQYAQRVKTIEEFNRFTSDLTNQLQQIKQSGAVTHFEFSGNTERKEGKGEWTGIKYFESLRNNIDSFGLGDSEVLPIIKAIKTEIDPSVEIYDGEDAFSLYKNGLTLLKFLNAQRVYIHGSSNDIVILNNSDNQLTPQDLETEVNACYYAKDKVTHHIKGDTPQLIVPESDKLSQFLKTKGINQISTFIKKVVKDFKSNKTEQAELINQISEKGYFIHDDHAVVIIPVKWIYRQDQVKVTVSAGDITSYVSTLYSGLAERIRRIRQSKTNRTDLVS